MFNKSGSIFALFVMFASAQAWAETPDNGFGLYGGLANHSMSAKFNTGGQLNSNSSGISIGIDYQIGLQNKFSLNPFLMSAGETGSSGLSGSTIGHGILGLQARYWLQDEIFIGAHFGSYSEVIDTPGLNTTTASGFGTGLTAGWESKVSGLITRIQIDNATIGYADANVDLKGFRIQLGYRWK